MNLSSFGVLLSLAYCSAFGLANAQQTTCQVTRNDFVNGGVAQATMQISDMGPCQFKFKFGGQSAPDTWELIQPPKSGKVSFGADYAQYEPDAGFVGEDKFTIALFGKAPQCTASGARCNRNGRYEITVTVKPKSRRCARKAAYPLAQPGRRLAWFGRRHENRDPQRCA